MKTASLRKHRAFLEKTEPIFRGNPVLSVGVCLPFVIVPSMTLKTGVFLSVLMFVSTIIPVGLYAYMGNKISKEIKVIVSAITSTSLVALFYFFTRSSLRDFYIIAGVYVILFGVNGITYYCQYRCEGMSVGQNLIFAFKSCIGYSIVVCFISFIRELFALNSIWDIPLESFNFKVEGIAFPFFGFIILGFLSAFFRVAERLVRKRLLMKGEKNKMRNEVAEDAE